MTIIENKSGRKGKLKKKITLTHALSWDDAYTLILSLGEWLDRRQGLGEWQIGDENAEPKDAARAEIRVIKAPRETVVACRFPVSPAESSNHHYGGMRNEMIERSVS
jgi:hypothetical protein